MTGELSHCIGFLPKESGFKKRMRFHQGWWRTFVLNQEPGSRPNHPQTTVASMINEGRKKNDNFLSKSIRDAVDLTIQERMERRNGMLDEERLYNNLLSSQPLCFNFFGELKMDTDLCLHLLRQFWPDITSVQQVIFEYSPAVRYLQDNSAFDVCFIVLAGSLKGLIGLECKYTDTFSNKSYDSPAYRDIYSHTNGTVFTASYQQLTSSKYNQLFRNQLIAESVLQHRDYDFVYTGLFCHQDDKSALKIGAEFRQMLMNGEDRFLVITFRDYIEKLQSMEISWQQRELSMMLWARYCAMQLSERKFKTIA